MSDRHLPVRKACPVVLTAEITPTRTDVDVVAKATEWSYLVRSESAEIMTLPEMVTTARTVPLSCVVAERTRDVEIVVDDVRDLAALVPATWALDADGWRLTVLTPLPLVGDAHRLLRGTPVKLQAWWLDGDDVLFGAFERP